MNLIKLMLLAFPVFLASILWVANPAQASSLQSASTTQVTLVVSAQPSSELVAPKMAAASHSILEQAGCNCASCTQSKFDLLQGQLPSVGI
ncbi:MULTISPECIES: hypothetical protein [unclassified Tolypothrix]|uniref:hypothetical protein n=1 Tax=unclassified Tolypothrix TaxID=2649714 RepID=UPI0005EAA6E2|nr:MULTISPECIES: hypothetical protein [unclassified Tolypothrix]BAY93831.1 hypothetical protein NIES3275_58750 [Microchaete diplosiphon NIES-3275]EKF03466.1 hypothetical protein FDUTEX481_02592 [Tolypothrix sp. PCC 7601]MBE9081950.1 hypothetical protein [Tolypothrix sp. LEGE 11397]UYD27616.1 hypothetical protein HGR01_05995 [Tolypothrix sp. PCC 7712]UYD36521.1 hypothetical protein HG267_12700 [Tolypothrix sp. PCC 7601]